MTKLNSLITIIVFILSLNLKQTHQIDHNENDERIEFSIRFLYADHEKAQFELVDDNITTINYIINYQLTSEKHSDSIYQEIKSNKTVIKQTNSDKLALKQLKSTKLIDDTDNTSGENYNNQQLNLILSESWSDMHQFTIDNLDENRIYKIAFEIIAKQAYLKHKKSANHTSPRSVTKQFLFNFETTFNYDQTAKVTCDLFKQNITNQIEYAQFETCYQNDCTGCKPNCYQLNSNSTYLNKPILCEPCPCDILKSTGACSFNKLDRSFQCKQCIKPYTGALCNQCENEGIDFYRDERGECIKCDCNGNSLMDLNDIRNDTKRRKCQAITGKCIDCMFNTTGKNCNKCKPGYYGDPLKRSCVLELKSSTITAATTTSSIRLDYLNTKHNYRSLALFSIYIFCLLFLILSVYVFIKYKYYQDATLKNGPYHPFVCCRLEPLWSQLNERRRDLTKHFSNYLSILWPKYSATNLLNRSSSLNDDDRLNLAENQIFDESLCASNSNNEFVVNSFTFKNTSEQFNENDDILINSNKNPYFSLTIKS